jgi:hypothetical protein
MLTEYDLWRLESQSLRRLQQQIAVLEASRLYIDLDGNLHIQCVETGQVAALLAIEATLKEQIYLVLGVWHVSLWLANEQVWEAETRSILEYELPRLSSKELESISTAILQEDAMATATLENSTSPTQIIDQATEAAVAPAVSQMVGDRLQAYFAGESFAGLVRSEVEKQVGEAIAHFQQSLNGVAKAPEIIDVMHQSEAEAAPAPEPGARIEVTHNGKANVKLKLPRGIEFMVTPSGIRPNLLRALPNDPHQQRLYLEIIVEELDNGKKWLNRLVTILHKRFDLPIESTYQSYLRSAKDLLKKTMETATGTTAVS